MIELHCPDYEVSLDKIEKFITDNDASGVFKTRFIHINNFLKHFVKLRSVGQILTFQKDEELVGLCSWVIVDTERKKEINKTTWTLPDNVSTGDIFYVDVCILRPPASIFKVKKIFDEKYREGIKEICWANMIRNQRVRIKLSGGNR